MDDIDKLEGAELDRLAFELGLCPVSDDFEAASVWWHPSTDIAQAAEVAHKFPDGYELEYYPDEEPHNALCEARVNVGIMYHDGTSNTEAEALTRACCKAAKARKNNG